MEALTLKLKLQYFVRLMRRADSLEKTLMLRMIEDRRRRGRQRMRWLDGITNSMNMSLSNDSEGQGVSGSFPVSQFFASGGQRFGVSASVLPMSIQD